MTKEINKVNFEGKLKEKIKFIEEFETWCYENDALCSQEELKNNKIEKFNLFYHNSIEDLDVFSTRTYLESSYIFKTREIAQNVKDKFGDKYKKYILGIEG